MSDTETWGNRKTEDSQKQTQFWALSKKCAALALARTLAAGARASRPTARIRATYR